VTKQIPEAARTIVRHRAHGRCERCGSPAPNGEWHHRRSRSVRDEHRHCPCNGLWLCQADHQWVHAHPFEARQTGFIVSRFTPEPGSIALTSPWGIRLHDCQGGTQYQEQP
jgi:hypothetical protein